MPNQSILRETYSRLLLGDLNRTEADIQHDVAAFLQVGDFDLDEDQLHLEKATPNGGRIDVEIGRTVVEIKRRIDKEGVVRRAVDQLRAYVADRTAEFGERFSGVLTDGKLWQLYRLSDANELQLVSELQARPEQLDRLTVWLEGALATKQDIYPTPDEIESRLGVTSSSYGLDMATLLEIYTAEHNRPEVQVKYLLWQRLLGDALGLGFSEMDRKAKQELFVRHTYLVAVAEIIAHLVIGIDVQNVNPRQITSGAIFRQNSIAGVVEADFFDWVADSEGGIDFLRTLARRLSRFNFSDPSHDILKVLYESVIDQRTRHNLGEYYTPDWLASQIVDNVVDDAANQTILDPACGSGTFLFWSIRKVLESAESAGADVAEAIEMATNRVYGIDLHPVAVSLARVTVLLGIGKERLRKRKKLNVQVFLGDSMMWRQPDDLFGQGGIAVHTTDGSQLFAEIIRFPQELVADIGRFDVLVTELTERASAREPRKKKRSIQFLLKGIPREHRSAIEQAYDVLCNLHDERRDHIWGYYIRNIARPFAISGRKIDRLVGNPPWLSYRYMDEGLQAAFREQSRARGLWAGGRMATHQDLSGFFVARSVERFLATGGKFGFVMPSATLKGAHYAGFRSGEWTERNHDVTKANLQVRPAWRLVNVKPDPFPVPSCVVFGERTKDHASPLSTKVRNWSAKLPKSRNLNWEAVEPLLVSEPHVVRVASGGDSAYRKEFAQGATLTPRRLVIVNEDPGQGPEIGPGLDRTFVCSRTSAQDKRPWSKIDPMRGIIETRFLFMAYLGENVVPFWASEPLTAVIPYDGEELLDLDNPALDLYPGLSKWWNTASEIWADNRNEKSPNSLLERVNYHSGLERQLVGHKLRVVYTTSGTRLAAAIIDDPNAIIDTSLYWCCVHSVEEAHYLTAILNSQTVLNQVVEYQPVGAFGPRHFHKHVFEVPVPLFDHEVQLHRDLAAAGLAAQSVAKQVNSKDLSFQRHRAKVRSAVASDGVGQEIESLVESLL